VVCFEGGVRQMRGTRAAYRRATELERAACGREPDRQAVAVRLQLGPRPRHALKFDAWYGVIITGQGPALQASVAERGLRSRL
jgi:hypothetical protein